MKKRCDENPALISICGEILYPNTTVLPYVVNMVGTNVKNVIPIIDQITMKLHLVVSLIYANASLVMLFYLDNVRVTTAINVPAVMMDID